jgi:2-dehydropantoate 2-reductase
MRICVFGAGSVGGHIAAKLAAAGNEVSVVSRGANLEGMKARGRIVLHSGDKVIEGPVRASGDPKELGPQDAVFVTAKANALPAIAPALGPLLGADTPVAFVQNGVPWWYALGLRADRPPPPDLSRLDPGGVMAKTLGLKHTVGGVVFSSNVVVEPGVVQNESPERNILALGEVDDRPSERVVRLREAIRAAGMTSPDTIDIRANLWGKLLRNLAGSTLSLLTGEPLLQLKTDERLREIAKRSMREALATAAAHGVTVDVDVEATYAPNGYYTAHKPSILQDYELGRPMEVEALIRTPLAFARSAGVPTPSLDVIVAVIVARATAKGLYSPD